MHTPELPDTVADHLAEPVTISAGTVSLPGILTLPPHPGGVVVFAHGSGSSRLSARNRLVADTLVRANFGALLFDLLSVAEAQDRANVFDIPLLADRLEVATQWLAGRPAISGLPLGYFGASTGAAAALVAAAGRQTTVHAIVSRGGRPDLAGELLVRVRVPTLLIVGGADSEVLALNRAALARLGGIKRLVVVPRATHLFEEPGALVKVAELASLWFRLHLGEAPAAQSA